MKYFIFLFVVTLFFSCKKEETAVHGKQEQPVVDANATISSMDVLKKLKNASIDDGVKILKSGLVENFDANLPEKAVDIISNVLFNNDSEEAIQAYTPTFLALADGKEGIANFYDALQAAYLTKYPQSKYSQSIKGGATISTLLANKADLINNKNFNRFSIEDAKDYIEMSEAYALVSPRDTDAGSQLIKAGNTAKSIRGYAAKAVVLYDWLLKKQKDHPKAGQALFLKAFTYDNELKKPELAKKLYQDFLAKYPKDDFADDAQLLLDNVGKTDQEFYETIVNQKDKK